MEWPVPLLFVTLDGVYAVLKNKFRGLPDAKLI
jgi:hypothetical protein